MVIIKYSIVEELKFCVISLMHGLRNKIARIHMSRVYAKNVPDETHTRKPLSSYISIRTQGITTIPFPQDVVYPSVYLYLKGLHFVAIPSLSAIYSFAESEKKIAHGLDAIKLLNLVPSRCLTCSFINSS